MDTEEAEARQHPEQGPKRAQRAAPEAGDPAVGQDHGEEESADDPAPVEVDLGIERAGKLM